MGGGFLGNMVGQASSGANIGHSMGAALSKWLGAGDYTVSRNSLVEKASTGIPMMHKTAQSIIVRHKEFIGTVTGTSAFTVGLSYELNPGLEATFPWLSQIANNFQEYSFKGLVFHYVPTSGNISGSNTALGAVMLQTSYRSSDTAPTSKVELLNEYWASETVPFDTMAHPIECDPKENPFAIQYVRNGTVPSGDNKLLYDLGVTYVATAGCPANVLGDIWVTYEVELKKPVLSSNITSLANWYGGYTGSGTGTDLFAGLTRTSGALGVSFDAVRTVTLPRVAGNYIITVSIYPASNFSPAIAWYAAATLTNCTTYTYAADYRATQQVTSGSSTAGTLTYSIGVTYTDISVTGTVLLPACTIGGGTISTIAVTVVRQS